MELKKKMYIMHCIGLGLEKMGGERALSILGIFYSLFCHLPSFNEAFHDKIGNVDFHALLYFSTF